jgi:hypothetical protein
MTIQGIRDGLATNLRNVPGLRSAPELIDNPSPPIAIVSLSEITYDQAYQKGLVNYAFVILVIVGRSAEREAQRRLDAYADDSGEQSIKAAIESDRTLGGAAYDCRVERMTNISSIQLGDATYLVAEFFVTVLAS